MARLLFELGVEELPASACYEAERQLPELIRRQLGTEPERLYIGPRRLAFEIADLPARTPAERVKGPPAKLREQAAGGFAAKHGLAAADLVEDDGFLWAELPGAELAGELLRERLAAIAGGLAFTKSMRWDDSGRRFSRPIRWTLALLDGETVQGQTSHGHRFTHGPVEIPSAADYAPALRAAFVEPDAGERRRRIVEGLDALGGWSDPLGKLEEVVHLAEWPLVHESRFAETYLRLPERLIVTAMQAHQRYFPLGGNRFALVANGGDPEVVVPGYTRVLEARLDDAAFTFDRDLAVGIEGLATRLPAIVFFEGGGTFAEKAARLVELVTVLGGGEASREAARLAKADQAAELVREFPDLEGHIGAEYARAAGFPEAVCAAIDEQYLPDAAEGPLPQTEAGRVLAAADKVDNLVLAFALGRRPTGSRDPYGLRRAAIGLCRLALEGALGIDVPPLVERTHELLRAQDATLTEDPAEVADFVFERLEGLLDVPVEFVRAARAGSVTELGAVARLAETLAGAAESEEFARAYVAFDRSARLAGKANGAAPALDPALATDEAELALIEALVAVSPRIEAAVEARDFDGALAAAAELGPPVDRFFDEVLVMADDQSVRANRLRLLLEVRDAVGVLGDLSQIPR